MNAAPETKTEETEVLPFNATTAGAERTASLPVLTLPYLEFSHALLRSVDMRTMAQANQKLREAMYEMVRRQQELAWELAQATMRNVGFTAADKPQTAKPGEVFDRAATAVRELGEALIEAQVSALKSLKAEAVDKKDGKSASA